MRAQANEVNNVTMLLYVNLSIRQFGPRDLRTTCKRNQLTEVQLCQQLFTICNYIITSTYNVQI